MPTPDWSGQICRDLRDRLKESDTTPLDRGQLAIDLLRVLYDHTKFNAPEGGGLDGRAGPERSGLGRLVDQAEAYVTDLYKNGLGPNTH